MQKTKVPVTNLLQGDALEVLKSLPENYFDAGVTSPPYNKQENKKGWLVKNVQYDSASDKVGEGAYQGGQIDVLNELYRTMKPGGSFFYNHKVRWERGKMIHPMEWLSKTNWTIRQEIIWDRGIAANIRGWRFWQVDERIYWLYKPVGNNFIGKELESRHALLTSIWHFPPERRSPHPAAFPLVLPGRALYSVLGDKGGRIIDPYIGSGTTAVAASLLGYDYVGIDISKEYLKMTKERVKDAKKELAVLELEMQKHKVNMTFKERKAKGKFTGRFKKTDGLEDPALTFQTLFSV